MNILERFTNFYEVWMKYLEEYYKMLNSLLKEEYYFKDKWADAVAKIMDHHEKYYAFKWAVVDIQVQLFSSPPWLTSLERLHFWFSDWRPSTIFFLVCWLRRHDPSFLSCHQLKMIEHLGKNINMEIAQVQREMKMEREAIVNWQIMETAREMSLEAAAGGDYNGPTTTEIEEMMRGVARRQERGFQKVIKMADGVRLKCLKGMLEILDVKQCVMFLAWFTYMQLELKWLGKLYN